MRRLLPLLLLTVFLAPALVAAQAKSTTKKSAPPRAPAPSKRVDPAEVACPSPLGSGVSTKRVFCDVPIGRTPADGITITIPPHKGATVLTFDLHNRMTYSEDLVRAGRAYARLTATIGVMTMDNTLLTRAVVQNEFRTAADLFDRISGGAGPGGLKAVAPTGREAIRVQLPADLTQVCVLGEKLAAKRADADEIFTGPGRPIALISNVMVEYLPGAAAKPPAKAPARKAPPKAPVKK
jgi:hypothetical protein